LKRKRKSEEQNRTLILVKRKCGTRKSSQERQFKKMKLRSVNRNVKKSLLYAEKKRNGCKTGRRTIQKEKGKCARGGGTHPWGGGKWGKDSLSLRSSKKSVTVRPTGLGRTAEGEAKRITFPRRKEGGSLTWVGGLRGVRERHIARKEKDVAFKESGGSGGKRKDRFRGKKIKNSLGGRGRHRRKGTEGRWGEVESVSGGGRSVLHKGGEKVAVRAEFIGLTRKSSR